MLEQTIYPASNRQLNIGVQGGNVDESRTASIPEMKDGLDSTAEQLHHYGGALSVCEYLWTMDAVTYAGLIQFVRIIMRQQIVINAGSPGGTNFQGHFNLAGPGIYSPFHFAQVGSFYAVQQDMPTNPQTGLAWTAAAINAGRFGYRIDDEGDLADFETFLSEFKVEIWSATPEPPAVSTIPVEPHSEYFKDEIRFRTGIDLERRSKK